MAESSRDPTPRRRSSGCLTALAVFLGLSVGLTVMAFATVGAALFIFITYAERGRPLPPPTTRKAPPPPAPAEPVARPTTARGAGRP
jgi:hypothetical protein